MEFSNVEVPVENVAQFCQNLSLQDLLSLSTASATSRSLCQYYIDKKLAERNQLLSNLRGTWINPDFSYLSDNVLTFINIRNVSVTVEQDMYNVNPDSMFYGKSEPLLDGMLEGTKQGIYPVYTITFSINDLDRLRQLRENLLEDGYRKMNR